MQHVERKAQAVQRQAARQQQKKLRQKRQQQRIIQQIQQRRRKNQYQTATEATKDSTEEVTTASKKMNRQNQRQQREHITDLQITNSVEIELSNGTFETFIVNDDDVKTALSKKSEGDKITFTYGAVEGQANKEILSVK